MTITPRLLVLGGSGFVGSQVCRKAVQLGYNVTSLSRRGAPPAGMTDSPSWMSHVKWLRGSALAISDHADKMSEYTSVIHCIGTLVDSSAPNFLKSSHALFTGDAGKYSFGKDDATYQKVNRDSVIKAADEAARHSNISSFVYISAIDVPKIVRILGFQGYMDSKREAEIYLQKVGEENPLRTVILRPTFIFSDSRCATLPLAGMFAAASLFENLIRQTVKLPQCNIVPKPISVDTVADCALESAVNPTIQGILTGEEIAKVATDAGLVADLKSQ
eukprot:GHVL01027229.1.p1 GENE.GHVL01027229.1~~GHVL01027229.1.p1  ORF type:complete len:275 (+),score=36.45 GHVL01027229.1:613-1437(+)